LNKFVIHTAQIPLADIENAFNSKAQIALSTEVWTRVKASRQTIENIVANEKRPVYGVTTGFGKFADVRISAEDTDELQRRIVLSHAAGVGKPMPEAVVKAMMLFKIISLSRGYSGIRSETLQLLLDLYNNDIVPWIPEKGSVGASGDLAPLAHMAMVLIGEGWAMVAGEKVPAADQLKAHNLKPVQLKAKEGLAVLNGTQAIAAYAFLNVMNARRLLHTSNLIGAMSVEALNGTLAAFDERIHNIRLHPGQQFCAATVRSLLADSSIMLSHKDSDHRVQDAYCLRCIPQVHGTVYDTLMHVETVVAREINAVTDNPLIFQNPDTALSGGNFHGEPIGMVMDFLAIAMSEIGSISERRIAHYMDKEVSELPPFLVQEGGLNSGFMMAHVTAAALCSENKTLAHPATIDSIPTSANKEDHVSMGTWAARKTMEILHNVEDILVVELLCATQGLDLRKPHNPATVTAKVRDLVRKEIAFWGEDRYMAADLARAKELLHANAFLHILP
jgi:histidine ammonia-lyase